MSEEGGFCLGWFGLVSEGEAIMVIMFINS